MSGKALNRRQFLQFSAMAVGAAALASCSPAAQSPAPAEKPVEKPAEKPAEAPTLAPPAAEGATIVWWYAWGNLDPAVKKIVELDEFKAWTGGNKLEYKGGVTSEAVLTAVAAGTPPDGGSNFDYPNLWSRGAVLPVNDLIDGSSMIKKDDILDILWKSCFYGDKMIGAPGIESYLWWGLNYNSQAVKDVGLDPDSPPQTWEDALAWHKKLTKFDSAGNLQQMGLDPYDAMAGEPDFASTSWGFQWWNEDARKFDLNNPLMAEALNTCGEFIRIVGPDKFQGMRQVEGQGAWGGSYNAGVQDMIIEGYWHPGETQIQKPEIAQYNRATWAPVPAKRKGTKIMATGAHFVQLFKDGKHPKEMFKVAEFLHNPKAMDIIFKEVGWIFGKKSWLKTVDPNAYPGLKFYIDAPDQVTDWLVGRRCPIHWFVTTQYTELREKVYRDLMTAPEAAEELQKRALEEWSNQGLS